MGWKVAAKNSPSKPWTNIYQMLCRSKFCVQNMKKIGLSYAFFFFFLHLHALFWFYTVFWTKYDSLWPFKIFSGLEKCGISKAEQHFSNLTLNIANCLLGMWVDSDVTFYCVNKILILLLHCFSDEVAGSSF